MPRPIRPWFRFYVEAFGDRKIRRLTPAQRWLWAAVLGAARESCLPGVLYVAPGEAMTHQELADYAGVPLRDVRSGLTAMGRMSMVTVEDDLIHVTNWDHRQFESDDVTRRTRNHRERSQEQSEERSNDVPANAPETETEAETETVGAAQPPAKRSRQFPEDFRPSEKHIELAAEMGVDLRAEWPQFVDHHRSKGSTMKDWDAALRTWIRNAKRFGRGGAPTTNGSGPDTSWQHREQPVPPPDVADDPERFEAWLAEQRRPVA